MSQINKYRKEYRDYWEQQSNYFFRSGLYEWASKKIEGSKFILEIGCGTGYGILSINKIKNVRRVISIDDNPECINKSEEYLLENNVECQKVLRGKIIEDESVNRIEYSKIGLNEVVKINLIEGDFLTDHDLLNWLRKIPIDCIVCWFIGTFDKEYLRNFDLGYKLAERWKYRMNIQIGILDLASEISTVDKVHILDRGIVLNTEQIMPFLSDVKKQIIGENKFEIKEFDQKQLEKTYDEIGGIAMINSEGDTNKMRNTRPNIISVLMKKETVPKE